MLPQNDEMMVSACVCFNEFDLFIKINIFLKKSSQNVDDD